MLDVARAAKPYGLSTGAAERWHRRVVHDVAAVSGWLCLEAPLAVLIPVVMSVLLLKDGLSATPGIGLWVRMAQTFPSDPMLAPRSRYMLSSPIGPGTAHVLGLTTTSGFVLLHLGVVTIAVAVIAVGLQRRAGRPAAGIGLVLFALSPLSDVTITWLGMQDAWLVLAFSALVLFDDPWVLGVAAAIGALAHPEMNAITVAATGLLRIAEVGWDGARRQLLAPVAGFVVGAFGTAAYELCAGGSVGADGSFIGLVGLGTLAADWARQLPALLWSNLAAGGLWVVLAARQAAGRLAVRVTAAGLFLAIAMTVVTLDETRIFALLAWPLTLWWVPRVAVRAPAFLWRAAPWLIPLFVLVPSIVVQAGQVHVSA